MNDIIKDMRDALESMHRYQVKRQDFDRFSDEIANLQSAIEEMEKAEPVAYRYWYAALPSGEFCTTVPLDEEPLRVDKLYTHPAPTIEQEEKADPVAWVDEGGKVFWQGKVPPDDTDLYLHPAPTIPPGWRLVPEEPTEEMIAAGADDFAGIIWKDMLAAAPKPEGV